MGLGKIPINKSPYNNNGDCAPSPGANIWTQNRGEIEGCKLQILQFSSTSIRATKLVRMDRLVCKKLDMGDHFLWKKRKGNVGDIGIELHERIILKAVIGSV